MSSPQAPPPNASPPKPIVDPQRARRKAAGVVILLGVMPLQSLFTFLVIETYPTFTGPGFGSVSGLCRTETTRKDELVFRAPDGAETRLEVAEVFGLGPNRFEYDFAVSRLLIAPHDLAVPDVMSPTESRGLRVRILQLRERLRGALGLAGPTAEQVEEQLPAFLRMRSKQEARIPAHGTFWLESELHSAFRCGGETREQSQVKRYPTISF